MDRVETQKRLFGTKAFVHWRCQTLFSSFPETFDRVGGNDSGGGNGDGGGSVVVVAVAAQQRRQRQRWRRPGWIPAAYARAKLAPVQSIHARLSLVSPPSFAHPLHPSHFCVSCTAVSQTIEIRVGSRRPRFLNTKELTGPLYDVTQYSA